MDYEYKILDSLNDIDKAVRSIEDTIGHRSYHDNDTVRKMLDNLSIEIKFVHEKLDRLEEQNKRILERIGEPVVGVHYTDGTISEMVHEIYWKNSSNLS